MASQTVRYTRTRLRTARTQLARLDPYLLRNRTWTRYGRTKATGTGY